MQPLKKNYKKRIIAIGSIRKFVQSKSGFSDGWIRVRPRPDPKRWLKVNFILGTLGVRVPGCRARLPRPVLYSWQFRPLLGGYVWSALPTAGCTYRVQKGHQPTNRCVMIFFLSKNTNNLSLASTKGRHTHSGHLSAIIRSVCQGLGW